MLSFTSGPPAFSPNVSRLIWKEVGDGVREGWRAREGEKGREKGERKKIERQTDGGRENLDQAEQ